MLAPLEPAPGAPVGAYSAMVSVVAKVSAEFPETVGDLNLNKEIESVELCCKKVLQENETTQLVDYTPKRAPKMTTSFGEDTVGGYRKIEKSKTRC